MTTIEPSRDLLLVLQALETNLLSRERMSVILHSWISDPSKSLAQLLIDQGKLTPDIWATLENRVRQHLALHNNDLSSAVVACKPFKWVQAMLSVPTARQVSTVAMATQSTVSKEASAVKPNQPPSPQRFRVIGPFASAAEHEFLFACDEELHRDVLLKTLQPSVANDARRQASLLREAKRTAALNHPGIVPVYGLGNDDQGRPFYAMRLIQGESFTRAIEAFHQARKAGAARRTRPAELRKLLRRFLDVCHALEYAHSRAIVHGDLEPGQVILGKYAETVVVSWGQAQPFGDGDDAPAADVYRLGTLLYNLLTGHPPYSEPQSSTAHGRAPGTPLHPPRRLKRWIPAALEAICLKALAPNPADRYASPRAVAEDIEHWLADEPVVSYRDPRLARLGRWARRHMRVVTGIAALVITAACILVASAMLVNQARQREAYHKDQEKRAAEEAQVRAEGETTAKEKAQASRTETLRQTLAIHHRSADSYLSAARSLVAAVSSPRRQSEALTLLGKASQLGLEAETALRELGSAGATLADTERRTWDERRVALRNEAVHWLTGLELCRGTTLSLPSHSPSVYVPDVAVSADGDLVAFVYGGGEEVGLVRVEGALQSSLHFPAGGEAFLQNSYSNSLHFPTNRSIELITNGQVMSWTLPAGPATMRPQTPAEQANIQRQIEERKKSGDARTLWGRSKAVRQVSNSGYTAVAESASGVARWRYWITLYPVDRSEKPRVVWRSTNVPPRLMQFNSDGRFLFVVAGDAMLESDTLILVDLASGLQTEERLPTNVEALDLLPCTDGVAILEHVGLLNSHSYQVTLASMVAPRIWRKGLVHPLNVSSLHVAEDGLIATGGEDHVVRLWREGRPLWQAGLSWDNPRRQYTATFPPRWNMSSPDRQGHDTFFDSGRTTAQTTSGLTRIELRNTERVSRAQPAGLADPSSGPPPPSSRWHALSVSDLDGFHYSLDTATLLLRDGKNQVVELIKEERRRFPLGVPAEKPYRRFAADSFYPWWDFGAVGNRPLVIQRTELSGRAAGSVWTEAFCSADGTLVHAFPPAGPGRILAMSSDHRLAVTVAEEQDTAATLDLWSLKKGQAVGRLATCPIDVKLPAGFVGRPMPVLFSPTGRWLLLAHRPGAEIEIWQTDPLQRTATIPLPGPRVRAEFDAAERRLLLVGPSFAGDLPAVGKDLEPPFGEIVEPESGKVICQLQGLSDQGNLADEAFRFLGDHLACISYGDLTTTPTKIVFWDAKTGQATVRQEPCGTQLPPGDWALRGALIDSNADDSRLVAATSWHDPKSELRWTCMQLWDVPGRKLLHQHHFEHKVNTVPPAYLRLVPDKNGVYLAFGEVEGRSLNFMGWRWSDGVAFRSKSLRLLALDDRHRWTLWKNPDHVFLYLKQAGQTFGLKDTRGECVYRASSPSGSLIVLETPREPQAKSVAAAAIIAPGVWDSASGQRLLEFPAGHRFAAFDPTYRLVGTVAPAAGELIIWDLYKGQELNRFKLPTLAGNVGTPRLTSYHSSQEGLVHTVRQDPIELRIHPGSDRVAVLSHGVIQLWGITRTGDTVEQRLLYTSPKPGHFTPVDCVAQSATAGLVASGGEEGAVLLWDRNNGQFRQSLLGHLGPIKALAFTPDGSLLVSASADGTLNIWRPDGNLLWTYRDSNPLPPFRCLAFRPQTRLMAAGTGDGRVILLDVDRREVLAREDTDGTAVQCLAFSPGGEWLAAGTAAGHVHCWHSHTLQSKGTLMLDSPVTAAVFLRDGLLVTGGRQIQFWDFAAGRTLLAMDVPNGPVQALAVNHAGSQLFVAEQGSTGRVLDFQAMQQQLGDLHLEMTVSP
jgi:WD40 repeat protein